ncbi:unnamed protein product [Urochloa humidicola]
MAAASASASVGAGSYEEMLRVVEACAVRIRWRLRPGSKRRLLNGSMRWWQSETARPGAIERASAAVGAASSSSSFILSGGAAGAWSGSTVGSISPGPAATAPACSSDRTTPCRHSRRSSSSGGRCWL